MTKSDEDAYAWPAVDLAGLCLGCGGEPPCWVCQPKDEEEK